MSGHIVREFRFSDEELRLFGGVLTDHEEDELYARWAAVCGHEASMAEPLEASDVAFLRSFDEGHSPALQQLDELIALDEHLDEVYEAFAPFLGMDTPEKPEERSYAASADDRAWQAWTAHFHFHDATANSDSPDEMATVGNGSTSFHDAMLAASWVFPVTAGSRTFSLDGGAVGSASFLNPQLTAIFVPFGATA